MADLREEFDSLTLLHDGEGTPSDAGDEGLRAEAMMHKVVADVIPGSQPELRKQIGRFEDCQHVGTGGMGSVFKAYDPDLRRFVAIKVCTIADDQAGNAIEHEARCLAKVAHPNVVAAYDILRTATDVLLVMEFVEGRTLRDWQAELSPPWRAVLDRYLDAGHELAAVHVAGSSTATSSR